MKVNEIFSSIEGEGSRSGFLSTFIRLFGCNLKCSYCDTEYSCVGTDFKEMSIEEIMQKVAELGNKRITLTGGEPLIHKNVEVLIQALVSEGYDVNIETNGAVDITPFTCYKNVMFTLDYKSKSSGMNKFMFMENFRHLTYNDVIKFVVGNREDLEDMVQVIKTHYKGGMVYVSPIFGQIEPKEIVEFMKENKLHWFRLQLQMHKFIWPVNERGV